MAKGHKFLGSALYKERNKRFAGAQEFPDYFNSWNYLSSIGSGITLISFFYLSYVINTGKGKDKRMKLIRIQRAEGPRWQILSVVNSLEHYPTGWSNCPRDTRLRALEKVTFTYQGLMFLEYLWMLLFLCLWTPLAWAVTTRRDKKGLWPGTVNCNREKYY